MSQTLYVVICRDRHVDDQITVHATRQGADAKIAEFQAAYAIDEVWAERDYGRAQGWVRYVETHDEGPRARIEKRELLP